MKVRAYTRNDDPYSQMLKNVLESNNVSFENIEVSRDATLLKEMADVSGQRNTPVLIIDEKVFCGFDREKIKEVLGLLKENE